MMVKIKKDSVEIRLNGAVEDDCVIGIDRVLMEVENAPEKPVFFYIDSPGGNAMVMEYVLRKMDEIKNITTITTLVMGKACSAAGMFLVNGTQGRRLAYPNATIMLHEPRSWFMEDTENSEERINRIVKVAEETLVRQTDGKVGYDEVSEFFSRDRFMYPEKARELNIIDAIMDFD